MDLPSSKQCLIRNIKEVFWYILLNNTNDCNFHINEGVPNPKDNIDKNDNEKDDETLTDVLPGEDEPVDCEERELEVKDD